MDNRRVASIIHALIKLQGKEYRQLFNHALTFWLTVFEWYFLDSLGPYGSLTSSRALTEPLKYPSS